MPERLRKAGISALLVRDFTAVTAVEVVLAALADQHLAIFGDFDALGKGFFRLSFHTLSLGVM